MALLISMRIAKICMPRLAHFLLYNSPAWLKTRSDGANVAVIPRSYGQQPSDKGYDIHFSCTPKQVSQTFLSEGYIAFTRAGHLTQCDCFGICYILPNQVFLKTFFHYWQNIFAGCSLETSALKHHSGLTGPKVTGDQGSHKCNSENL